MRAVIYSRISTTDKNQNPEVQLVPLREFVEKRGWELTEEVIDKESGLSDKRSGFESVRAEWGQIFILDLSSQTKGTLLTKLNHPSLPLASFSELSWIWLMWKPLPTTPLHLMTFLSA